MDDGFTYELPDGMDVRVGSVVRIRVSGKRRRGFVTAVFERPKDRTLVPVDAVSGSSPTFDEALLTACRWAATHYVAPLSTVLARTVPPNVPKAPSGWKGPRRDEADRQKPLIEIVASIAPHIEAVAAELDRFGPRPVLAPTSVEVDSIAEGVRARFNHKVVTASSSQSNRAVTEAWKASAYNADVVLVGTRETALWMSASPHGFILVEDGRRVMKSPSTPTLHARELLVERVRRSSSVLSIVSPVPTLESLSVATGTTYPRGRLWAPTEVIDRSEEPPGASLLTSKVRHAIGRAVRDGSKVFVLVARRGYAPAYRCRTCGELRRCATCQTASTPDPACRRCGAGFRPCPECGDVKLVPLGAGVGRIIEDISRFVEPGTVGNAADASSVVVGSERDLVNRHDVDLAVVVDIDGMLGAPHYRAAEDTLRLVARLGQSVVGGRGGRMMIQTSNPDHPVVHALASGHPQRFLGDELGLRTRAGFPPKGSLIAIEVSKGPSVGELLRSATIDPAKIRGPAPMRDRNRWLIQGEDLLATRLALRPVIGKLRADGLRVRVDADPIDL
jgi:primosomal protein N' (replication factor Y)